MSEVNDNVITSIEEKRGAVNQLAYLVGYNEVIENKALKIVDGEYIEEIPGKYYDAYDLAHGIMDVGYLGDKIIEGRCSLQASIDFSMDDFEEEIDKDICTLRDILHSID